jgi:hypothetical protein
MMAMGDGDGEEKECVSAGMRREPRLQDKAVQLMREDGRLIGVSQVRAAGIEWHRVFGGRRGLNAGRWGEVERRDVEGDLFEDGRDRLSDRSEQCCVGDSRSGVVVLSEAAQQAGAAAVPMRYFF